MHKQSEWMSFKEVLDDLDVPRSTMDDWRARGDGPVFTKFPGGHHSAAFLHDVVKCPADLNHHFG